MSKRERKRNAVPGGKVEKTGVRRVRKIIPRNNLQVTPRPFNQYGNTKYDPETSPHIAYSVLKNTGCDNAILGEIFNVGPGTVNKWRQRYPAFKKAVIAGRDSYNANNIENKLVTKCNGYRYEEETWELAITGYEEAFNEKGKPIRGAPIREMICTKIEKKERVPDTTSIIFWLKNRESERWKDVHKVIKSLPDGPETIHNHLHQTQNNTNLLLADLGDDELRLLENLSNKQQLLEAPDASGTDSKH